MEASYRISSRGNHDVSELQNFEMESLDHGVRSNHQFRSTRALDILNETIRVLRYNLTGFMGIAALLICPMSAVLLSNVLVNQSLVKKLTIKILQVAESCGFPLTHSIKQLSHKFSETTISSLMSFPLYITMSLLSKSAIIHSVDYTYARKAFDASKFYAVFTEIWRRLISTYLWVCLVIVGCLTLFLSLLASVSSLLLALGLNSHLVIYPAIILGLLFCVLFANALVICNVAIVVSVLEDVSGFDGLLRSRSLIRGQTQLGISLLLGSAVSMAFVEGLFDHRVKTVSYGDGSSRMWEGPLLVIMYSFVLLIDGMMSAVFYFSCKSFSMEASNEECQPVLEAVTVSSGVH